MTGRKKTAPIGAVFAVKPVIAIKFSGDYLAVATIIRILPVSVLSV